MPEKPIPAARLASEKILGFRTKQVERVVVVGVTPSVVAPNNPDRIFLQLINEGANNVFVGRNGEVTTASGIPILNQWDFATWKMETDGEATGYERHAIASGAGNNVRVIETVRIVNA